MVFFTFTSDLESQPSISFQYTGRVQSWTVPSCVTRVKIEVWGAQGGNSMDCLRTIQPDGGLGGYTVGELNVGNGQVLYILVGGQGRVGTNGTFDGGYNGGGDGGRYGAGGGGATDLRSILNDLDSRIIVAGGGGGGNTGCPINTGTGGSGGGPMGGDGISLYDWSPGGGGGTAITPGSAGFAGEAGTWGQGGHAGNIGNPQFHISGGGGGWFGGGSAYGAGGGGGSAMSGMIGYDTLKNGISENGIRTGNGLVVITLLEGAECVSCELVCKSKVNISMPPNDCYMVINPDQVLSGINRACTTFGFGLNITYPFGTSRLYGNDVDRSHLGHTLIYTVKEGDNSCWGYLTVEDKAPPVSGCHGTQSVSCYQLSKLLDITTQVIDNCSSKNTAAIERLSYVDFGCNNPLGLGRINRSIRVRDSWGNTSTCSDTLYIQRDSLHHTLAPDQITLTCRMICKSIDAEALMSEYEEINFSKDPAHKYYPDPELLLRLQHQDSLGSEESCLSPGLKVVPYLFDSVLVWEDGQYHKEWLAVNQYPFKSTFCKITLNYTDKIIDVCTDGSSFKIRRQWRLTDWCSGEERILIQNIELSDHTAPTLFMDGGGLDPRDNRLVYRAFVGVHSCQAEVDLKELVMVDCSPNIKQSYTASYTTITHPGTIIIKQGSLPGKLLLPATNGVYGVQCHRVDVRVVDGCLNRYDTVITVCVVDETPPELVLDGPTRLTVDPATCWSRVYAKDLDNGSRDNCCDVLHFAIANLDSVNSARQYVYNAIIAQCGIKDYLDSREYYDFYIEDYIASYIFKDYLDLSACKEYQIVVRVWEACGIPRYDPHIWPCSEHQWFLYNAGYPRSHYRADHNLNFGYSIHADYTKFNAPKDCNWRYPLVFCDPLLSEWFAVAGLDDFSPAYIGAGAAELCNFEFYWPRLGLMGSSLNGTNGNPPGNTCSRMLWKDGMVRVTVDDKTGPVAENPQDIFWYCDNVSSTPSNQYEYAQCSDESYEKDNAKDHTWSDGNQAAYHEIECLKENDGDLGDAVDPVGKPLGWYGGIIYGHTHEDVHGDPVPCETIPGTWAPVYCHSWLCLDAYDQAVSIDPETAFSRPVFHTGPPGAEEAGPGRFWIWDNCSMDTAGLTVTDSGVTDQCGNGWLLRNWTLKDVCGNAVSVDQKIVTRHRSDFEAIFPEDIVSNCGNHQLLTPEHIGKPEILDDACELVGAIYTDEIYDIVPDACYKIIRTWRLVDWCKFDATIPNAVKRDPDVLVDDRLIADTTHRPCVYRHIKDNGDGVIIYVQVIKVIDTIAPTQSCRDTTICVYDEQCQSPSTLINFTGSDQCTPADQLSYRWEMDENPAPADLSEKRYNKTSINKKSKAGVTNLDELPLPGKSLVHVIVSDRCGNEDTCAFILTVNDCKKPTPYCYNGIATLVMPSVGSVTIWARDLDAGSYDNCTIKSKLTFSFGTDPTAIKKEFTCLDIPNGRSASIPLDIYVWDESGQYDFCKTYILLQDGSGDGCPDLISIKNKSKIKVPLSVTLVKIEGQGGLGEINELKTSARQSGLVLLQNYPNPFHSSTWIEFRVSQTESYKIIISDLTGRSIWQQEGIGKSGLNQVEVLGSELRGPGVYYYTLETPSTLTTKKMIHTQ